MLQLAHVGLFFQWSQSHAVWYALQKEDVVELESWASFSEDGQVFFFFNVSYRR